MIPFSVHVAGDPDGSVCLVLGVSAPYLLVGPKAGEASLRWVQLSEVTFGRVYYDQPWHAPFTQAPTPAAPA